MPLIMINNHSKYFTWKFIREHIETQEDGLYQLIKGESVFVSIHRRIKMMIGWIEGEELMKRVHDNIKKNVTGTTGLDPNRLN